MTVSLQTKEQGKGLLKQIAMRRGKADFSAVPMDETDPNISQSENEAGTSNMEMISIEELES